jgi:phospho-N-acetylmuramoyl-pentapeptide-transferase
VIRSVISFLACLAAGLVLYPALITALDRLGAGQRIQGYGPRAHRVKAGTPTMGGILICFLVVTAWLIFDHSRSGWLTVFALGSGAGLGLLDDIANVRGELALGLLGRQKIVLQVVIGVLVGIGLTRVGQTQELIPFVGPVDLHWGIIILAAVAIVAASNAVNLTDGVDGLAASCSIAVFSGTWVLAMHPYQRSQAVLSAAMVGSLLAFLVYNWHPARIFMGDTGSMAIGCVLVVIAAELQVLWLLPLLGVVFVAETASVIINVAAVKRYQRRVFRASPLHHHFEALGLREQRLVASFAAAALGGAVATVLLALPYGKGWG